MQHRLRIIAERDHSNHWTAWYADQPGAGWAATTPRAAVLQLVASERRPEVTGRFRYEQRDSDRVVLMVLE